MKKIISLLVVATMLMSLFVVAPVSAATTGTVTTASTASINFGRASAIDVSGVSTYTIDVYIEDLDWLGDGAYLDAADFIIQTEGIEINSLVAPNTATQDLTCVVGSVTDIDGGRQIKVATSAGALYEGMEETRRAATDGLMFTITYSKLSSNTGSTGVFKMGAGGLGQDTISGYKVDMSTVCDPCTVTFEKAAAPTYDVPVYTAEELGGVGSTPIATLTDKETVTETEANATLPASVTGHTFSKWVYGASYEAATDASFPLTLVEGSSLYAVYTANSYPVTWSTPVGGTIAVTAGGSSITSGDSVKYGTEVVVTLTPNTDEYYSGGALTVNGSASATTFTMPAQAVALAATFTAPGAASVTIYEAGTQTVLYSNTNFTSGDKFTLAENLVTVPAYKVFAGYTLDNDDVTGEEISVVGDVVVYASFDWEEYTITFNADGATSGVPSAITATYEDTRASVYADNNIADAEPVAAGKTFVGWTETQGGTSEFLWNSTKITGNISLFPIWYTLETGSGIKNVTIAGLAATASGSDYSAKVPASATTANVIINLADNAQKATITIDGEDVAAGTATALALQDGENVFAVVVTAEDGSTSEYTITITKAEATESLQIEVGNTTVSPAYAGEVATIPVKVGGASVATNFWATAVDFTYDSEIFTFDAENDILWNDEIAYEYQICNTIDNGDGTTTVIFAVALEDYTEIAATDWLVLADLKFTLAEDQDSNTYSDIFINEESDYTPDPETDAVLYGNLAEDPYGRVTFLINNPAITEVVINSKEDGTGVAGGIEVTRETAYITSVKAVKDPNATTPEYYDLENDNVELTYQWTRDGVDIDGATGTSYVLTDDDVQAKIAVKVTIKDLDADKEGTSTVTVFDTVYHRGDANLTYKLDLSDAAYVNALINETKAVTNADVLHLYDAHVDDPFMDGARDAQDVTSLLQLRAKVITHEEFDVLGN